MQRTAFLKWTGGLRQLFYNLFYRDGTSIFSVLREDDYRHLWIGQTISIIGDSLAYNAITLSIIFMAKDAGEASGKYLGLLAVLSALPPLIIGMIAGTIADRANRKHMMIAADVIRGVLTLGFILVQRLDQVWIYIVVSVLLSSVSTFFWPARTALMPELLGKKKLLHANALGQLTVTLCYVLGAAIAGYMVQHGSSTAPAFIADSLSFFVSAFFITKIGVSGKVQRETISALPPGSSKRTRGVATLRSMIGDLVIGVRYVLTDQVMRGVLISFLALMLGLGAANVTFVPLLINELGMESSGLGLIRFTQALGIVLGSAIIGGIAMRYRARDLIGGSMVVFGVTTIMVAITPTYPLMVGVLFLVGLVIAPPQIVAPTLMQRHVPGEKLGRASGAQGTIVTVANIASMGAAGYLMDQIGAREIFMVSGTMIIAAGIVSWWVLRGVEEASAEDMAVPEAARPTR